MDNLSKSDLDPLEENFGGQRDMNKSKSSWFLIPMLFRIFRLVWDRAVGTHLIVRERFEHEVKDTVDQADNKLESIVQYKYVWNLLV